MNTFITTLHVAYTSLTSQTVTYNFEGCRGRGILNFFSPSNSLPFHCGLQTLTQLPATFLHLVYTNNTGPLKLLRAHYTFSYHRIWFHSNELYIHEDSAQSHCHTRHLLHTDHTCCYNRCRSSVECILEHQSDIIQFQL